MFESNLSQWDNIGVSGFRWFGTTYIPSSTQTVCQVGLALGNPNGDSDAWDIILRSGGSNPGDGTILQTIETTQGQYPTSTNPGYTYFDLPSCEVLDNGSTYFVEAVKNGGGSFTAWKMGKSIGSDAPELTNVWYYNGSIWQQFSGTQELAVGFNGNFGVADTILFTFPTDEAALPSDFTKWEFSYTLGDSATSSPDIYFSVQIDYTASSTATTYTEIADSYIPADEAGNGGSILTFKDNLLLPDTYTATATLFSVDLNDCTPDYEAGIFCSFFNEFASSTLATDSITFSIGGLEGGLGDVFNSTSTIETLSATCDASSNFFSESLCKMFITLFIPSTDSLEQFDGISALIQTKPPLGYFTQTKNALTNYASGTLATAEFSFSEDIGGFSPIATLRTAFAWIFWLVFGFWVFHRLRHFDFHI